MFSPKNPPREGGSVPEIYNVTISSPGLTDAAIILPGQTEPTHKRYPYAIAGMQLAAGDQALALKISGTYVILGGAVSGSGSPGVTYFPAVSPEGVISWTNDGGLPNPSPVNIKGPTGEAGVTYFPAVSPEGVISWTNDGGLPNPSPVNIKGPTGEAGATLNLLDDWYFGSGVINQRGQNSYSLSGGAYGIDRWKSGDNPITLTLAEDGMTLAASNSATGTVLQVVSTPFPALAGKTVTYSVLYDGGLATGSAVVPSSLPESGINLISLSSAIPNGYYVRLRLLSSGTIWAQIGQTAGNSLKFIAAKLELGNSQTLAHQKNGVWTLNELPDRTAELAKCRRYYQRFTQKGATIGYVISNVIAYNASSANLTLRLGMQPTADSSAIVSYSNIADIVFAAARIDQGIAATSISGAHVTDSGDLVMNLNAANALTAGAVYNAALKANGAWIAFSTEP